MNIFIYSRQNIETLIRSGCFPVNVVVISFCDPPSVTGNDYKPVDFSGLSNLVFMVELPDLDWYAYPASSRLQGGLLPDAKKLAAFIFKAAEQQHDILCQCEYGQSRSAGCAAAILEYFHGTGKSIFEDTRYYPNHLVYDEVLRALTMYTE